MIRAVTNIDHENHLAIDRHAKSRPEYKTAFGILLALLIMPVMAICFLVTLYYKAKVSVTICTAIMLYFLITMMWSFWKALRRPVAPKEIIRREYCFSDEAFGLMDHRIAGDFERFRRYESVSKAVEWKEWIIVSCTDNESCAMKKTDLTEGTVEELRALLKNKLGSRFEQHD